MMMMLVMVNIWIPYLASQYSECINRIFFTLFHVFIMLFLSNHMYCDYHKQQRVLY